MLQIKTYSSTLFPDLIERIWVLENDVHATNVYIPPHPYHHLTISCTAKAYGVLANEIDNVVLEGLCFQHSQKLYKPFTQQIGVRFYPYGAYPFFTNNKNKSRADLNEFRDLLIDQISPEAVSAEELIPPIEAILKRNYVKQRYESILPIKSFYQQVRWGETPPDIQKFCENNGLHYTGFNRLFSKVLGVSPKKFDRLIKFRRALCNVIDSELSLSAIGHGAGYFDQAHFIREFKIFSETNPSAYQRLMNSDRLLQYNFRSF